MIVEKQKPSAPATNGSTKEKSGDMEANIDKDHPGTASAFQAGTHLFKGSVGAGLFAMGDCFKNGGVLSSLILLPIIAVIAIHCIRMLIAGSIMAVEKTPGATYFDYPETVEKCLEYGPKPLRRFSKLMKLVVELFLCVTQFGFCSIYFVFITENLHQILIQNGVDIDKNTVMLIALLPAMLPSLLTNLKNIAPISLIANCTLLLGLIATLSIALKDNPFKSFGERNLFTNGEQMSLFFGTALFAYEGIALVLPMRNSMREPEKFITRFGVLNVTLSVMSLLFITTGLISYLRWGEEVEGSITLNLDPSQIFSQVVKIVATLGVFFGYPIQFMVLIRIIWVRLEKVWPCALSYPTISEVIFRFIMVIFTFIVAFVVPKLGLFISLAGAMFSTSLALIFPVLVDFVVKSQIPKALTTFVFIKNMLIVIVAVFGVITCTYQSIVEIVREFEL